MNFTHLTNELSIYQQDRIVFVGLGNKLRADDAAGLKIIERLKSQKVFKDSQFIMAGRNPENHLQVILNCNPDIVVFIDAAEWNGSAGDVKIFNDEEIDQTEFSTHTFSIKMIKDYLLNQQEMNFMFIGIQPLRTNYKQGLSEPVQIAIEKFFCDEV
ncbi:MAG TPA: hydrogenase maturation protease [Ignavibacteriaceae bacterium]|nr:hydrogenase maturation protease [Ignavibacteriaceae bacterium]